MKNVIVLFGKPGAGKGTRLSEFLEGREEQFEVLSVGNLLRKARQERTELGKKVEGYIDSGRLVPDEIINELVLDGIKNSKKNVILDGSPRTAGQAKAMINAGIYPDKVINLYVDDELVLYRTSIRITCEKCGESYTTDAFRPPKQKGICDKCGGKLSKRPDDEEEVVRNRLRVYENQTYPVLDIFSENNVRIITIDNSRPEKAREELKKVLTN